MYQKITIVGRLGKNPDSRFTPSGTQVASFSVATDHTHTDSTGQKVSETTWFRVQVWGKMAEACSNYLSKGKLVLVEGRLMGDPKTGSPRIWEGQDGEARANFEISAEAVKFLSPKDEQPVSEDSGNYGMEF